MPSMTAAPDVQTDLIVNEAHAATVAVLTTQDRSLFESKEISAMLDLAEQALDATATMDMFVSARTDLAWRIADGRALVERGPYMSSIKAKDLALDCWAPLEQLAGALR